MQNFSDRFVNLIAFSLGTVVVFHCLKRLSDCGKLHLINRVVTLGGVADQKEIS
jgi:pimeloyl-ACP methyl ester carboxylesterase